MMFLNKIKKEGLKGILLSLISKGENIYLIKEIRDFIRPLRHFICGKDDIYRVIDEIKERKSCKGVKIIFDVGAAVGDRTITLLKSFPKATVYCFEPLTVSYQQLVRRTSPYRNRIKLFNFGLYNQNGKVDLHIIASSQNSSSILSFQDYPKKQGPRETGKEKISVVKLDDFVNEHKIDKIDFIKIDVEGAEKEVIEGGFNTFKNKIDNAYIEITPILKGPHSADYIKVFQYLHETGFTLVGNYGDYYFSKL